MEVIDDHNWLDKTAAAALLGVQIRQLEKRASQGFIAKTTLPRLMTERTAQVRYSRRDIEAFKRGQPNRTEAPAAAPSKPVKKQEVARAVVAPRNGDAPDPFAGLAAHLARLAQAFPPAAQARPWLTLAEAAEFSGLPASWLLAQAQAGAIDAVDVGSGGKKKFWRFNRDALTRSSAR